MYFGKRKPLKQEEKAVKLRINRKVGVYYVLKPIISAQVKGFRSMNSIAEYLGVSRQTIFSKFHQVDYYRYLFRGTRYIYKVQYHYEKGYYRRRGFVYVLLGHHDMSMSAFRNKTEIAGFLEMSANAVIKKTKDHDVAGLGDYLYIKVPLVD